MCAESVAVRQVPAATGLTLRVINNVVKKMDVKSKFYEAFRKEGYPATFEYKQKVSHLLPQKQEHHISQLWGAGLKELALQYVLLKLIRFHPRCMPKRASGWHLSGATQQNTSPQQNTS